MNAIIENDSIITKQGFSEISKSLEKKKFNMYFLIFGIIIYAMSIYMIYSAAVNKTGKEYQGIIFLIVGLFVIIYPLISHIVRGHRLFNAQKKLANAAELRTRVLFYEGFLTVLSVNGAETVVNYKDITRDFETESMYAIITKQGVCVFMNRDSFIKGSLAEAREIIKHPVKTDC